MFIVGLIHPINYIIYSFIFSCNITLNMGSTKSRRSFIKKSSAIGLGVFIIPRHVLGGKGFIAPSDQLNIAAIGSGGKGISDISNAAVNGRERISALCDVDFSGSASQSVKIFQKQSSLMTIEKCWTNIKISMR